MKIKSILSLLLLTIIFAGCGGNSKDKGKKDNILENNPFMKESTLPYGAPDFTKIRDKDFQPAMEEGRKEQIAEIKKIANNTEPATFENTMIPLEKSGQILNRVTGVFGLIASANTNPEIQRIEEEEAPKMASHNDSIFLDDKLFQKIDYLYEKRKNLPLDPESKKLIEYYYNNFCMSGAQLPSEEKEKLKELNKEEALLSAKFSNRLMAATNAGYLIVDKSKDIKGLPISEIQAAALRAKEKDMPSKYIISLSNTTQQPALQYIIDRETRHKLYQKSWIRAEKNDSNDTRKIIIRLAKIRSEKANLLGFDNYSAWNLQDQMAKTPENVEKFLSKLIPTATKKAKEEIADIQKIINKEKDKFKLKPWDWNYYAEKVRKKKFDLDDNEIKPYFELNKVLKDGVFFTATKLYGITFKERHDIPVYNKDVRVFELFNQDSTAIGLFYCDYYKRDNKSGGAWMDNIITQSKLLHKKPVIYNVGNFPKPDPGKPALISYDDVVTMFHEFGHALHGFFADEQYPSLSGTNVARDFVEFPSQFNEHWALYPDVLKNYAVHYKTGGKMPQSLIDKIKKSATFNQGYNFMELLSAAELDMQWHTITVKDTITDVDKFEEEALKKTKLNLTEIPPRYRSSYFLHIWQNGYASGYYAYIWAEMLDNDAFSWFEDNGGLTRKNGQRFRDMILSRGNTEDYIKMFNNLTGHNPRIEPLLKHRGLE